MMMGERTSCGPGGRSFQVSGSSTMPGMTPGIMCLCAAMLAGALIASDAASAQVPPPPPPPPDSGAAPPPPPPAPAPANQPGFIDAIGRFIGDSTAKLGEGIKSTGDAIDGIGAQATGVAKGAADMAKGAADVATGAADVAKDAAGAAGQATGAIVDFTGTRSVKGRERCAVAANGAPDCVPAANALCRSKGFASGRGTDINSRQKCPAWVYVSGRGANSVDCTRETYVLTAVCQ
jgi:hypothetical protein